MKKKKNTDKKITRRTLRLEARVTEQEYTQVAELAKTCGLSMSGYIRRTALGQHPRQRLTNREVEALCSLTDARGWKSHSTLTLLATQNYPFLLKYDCPLWLK